MTMTESPYLTVAEVADQLRVDQETVRRWLRDRKLRGTNLGRAGWRITQAELNRFLEDRTS